MYGIFSYIYHKNYKNQPNVAKYTIHGSYGYANLFSLEPEKSVWW